MPKPKFVTLSDDLLPAAGASLTYFQTHGYTVHVEKRELAHPYQPAFVARRGHTTMVAEIGSRIDRTRVERWNKFAQSCSKDTRIAFIVPQNLVVSQGDYETLQAARVGLYRVNGDQLVEVLVPHDLAVRMVLPTLDSLEQPVRRRLAPAYEKFERGDWRGGFEDAVQVLEREARSYLKDGIASSRIVVLDEKGNPKNPTQKRIAKMTLGQLGIAFSRIQSANHLDSLLAALLEEINPDRIGVVHHKDKRSVERRLRTNVGENMWKVIRCLSDLK